MRKGSKKIGLGVVAMGLCLVLLLGSVVPTKAAGSEQETVKVGLLAVFTGPAATTSAPGARGYVDYMRYLNKHGGIDGIKVDVRWEETKAFVPESLKAYKRFREAGVVAITCYSSVPMETLLRQQQRDEIPNVSIVPITRRMLSRPQWIFGSSAGYGPEATCLLKWIKDNWTENRPPRFATLAYDHASAWDMIEGVKEWAPKLGIDYIGNECLGGPPIPPIDVSTQWMRLEHEKPDWVYVYCCGAWLTVAMKDADRLGIQAKGIELVGNFIGLDENMVRVTGKSSEGWYCLGPNRYVSELEELKLTAPAVFDAAKAYRGDEPRQVTSVYIAGWNAGMVLAEGITLAISEVGFERLSGRAVRDSLASIKDFRTGLVLPVTMTDERPCWAPKQRVLQVRQGVIVVCTDWMEPLYFYKAE